MKRWFAKSLNRKLSLLILFAVVLPLLTMGTVSYRIATSVTEDKAKEAGMNTLRQMTDKLDFVIQDVENMSIFLIGQRDVQAYLGKEESDINLYSQLIGTLWNLSYSKKYIANITITPKNSNPVLYTTTITNSGLAPLLQQYETTNKSAPKWWSPLYDIQTSDGLRKVISLVRPIRDFSLFKTLGTLSFSLDQSEIEHYLTDAGWETSGFVVLVDANNRIIAGGDRKWLMKEMSEVFPNLHGLTETSGVSNVLQGMHPYTVLYNGLPRVGWKLVGFIPTEIYQKQNGFVLTVTAVTILIALLLAMALVIYFLRWVTNPLMKLTKYLKDLNPDETIPTFEVKSVDEVGLLVHSYNKLSDRISRLKHQVQLNEAMKKEADIMALQAQINPHFLYNTLSSIHWIALMNKDRQIAEMVGALSDFLRFSLNKGEEFCVVQQEVSHARNYAYIQAIRFPDQFEIEFFIEPEMTQSVMLKLLLQPLIENSLIHGIQKKKTKGHIYVHGELREHDMKFVVEDTGIGMDEAKLRDIHGQLALANQKLGIRSEADEERKKVVTSYGLINVHRRLLLHYGAGAGLVLESTLGTGTRITFLIPRERGESTV
ncbi:cache domain-containing sensor histidine kinase [Paenibacillus qinlingensis]|uniref:cache domain-containing sensor histidine kinase n=1 Tax=Paenibacillus qinlingensis TaxID=1837343 RepID=UPI0015650589|nr:sensor histidine kinase [Paenibacillus qinlingensis]NQX64422.1 sensor histidine kinase [Paenibacillus qinlingensis]